MVPKPQFWCPPLRFGSQHRIPKHLFFLVFWVSTADFGFFLPGDEEFRIFSWGSGRKKAHKHKLFALVNVRMALGQTAGCPRVNRAKKFMCSSRNIGNINLSLWLTGGLSQGCPDFQKVYVFKVYVPFSCPRGACHDNQGLSTSSV